MTSQESSGSPPQSPAAAEQEMYGEFQFLLCENCKKEAKCPKLLFCLHNLCSECFGKETSDACPLCGTPQPQGTPRQDNLLFGNLQAKLSIYQKITAGDVLVCDLCKNEAEFWCSDCAWFLCVSCFESHQKFQKREGHEAKSLKDLRAESSHEFFAGIRKQQPMFCSNEGHGNQMLSIYCKECKKCMCCICVVLDLKHSGQHCLIREEVQRKQDELRHVNEELKVQKDKYSDTCDNLWKLMEDMEKVRNEMTEQIQKKVDEMLRRVKEEGEKLVAAVEKQHHHQVEDIEKKLQHVEGVRKRMSSSEQLVEKMFLYATDQEVMDMHLFIMESMKELRKVQPPVVDFQIQVENFAEVQTQLQALFDRVTREEEAAPANLEQVSKQDNSVNSPAKRKCLQEDVALQTPPKVIKIESGNSECQKSGRQASCSWLEQPGTSSEFVRGGSTTARREAADNNASSPSSSSSELPEPDDPICLEDEEEEEDDDDDDFVGSSLFEDISSRSERQQDKLMRHPFSEPTKLDSGDGSIVFFDLKLLPGNILYLVAMTKETKEAPFSIMIQPLLSSPGGTLNGSLCTIGLDHFLHYLHSLHKPILVGYNLWSMDLPILVNTLEAIHKEEVFEASIFGFLDALPLIKERVPDLTSYKLKSLDSLYLWGTLDDTQPQDCASTVMQLCFALDIDPAGEKKCVVAYSSLRCYASLQPLLRAELLSRPSAQTLALHSVCLSRLQAVYQNNPNKGLQKFGRYLNSRRRGSKEKIQNLSKVGAYFQALPSSAWHPSPAAQK